jgi:hypothetical protein
VTTTTRPRGFAPWRPQRRTQALLDQVREVLDTYSDLLPLTLRQVFYRLVAAYDYPKTEQAYGALGEMLNRARRAGIIPMGAIRDDGAMVRGTDRFTTAQAFLDACRAWAEAFELDLMQSQPIRLELACEAAGMVPQLEQVARPYGVAVRSSGGFDSTTVKHTLGQLYGRTGKPVVLLHVGDLDPSGVHIASSLEEDVAAFAEHYGGEMHLVRVAVTAEQQQAYSLPTSPPKARDRREFAHTFTVQAEALPPDELARIVREAIEAQLDLEALAEAQQEQAAIRAELSSRLAGI